MNENTPNVTEEPKELKQNEQPTQAQSIQEPIATPESNEDPNWRIVREQRKAERKAREEAEKKATEKAAEAEALRHALEALANKPSQGQQNYFNQSEESDDERIEKKVAAAIKKKEEEYAKQQFEAEQREYPQRLRQNMPDFDKVCTAENIDYLEYHHPEIAEPFRYMPDGYKKWEAMYKVAKKLIPNMDTKKDMAKVEKNLAKPGSISSTGTTQHTGAISQGARLTEEKKQENWIRMQKALKGLS